MIRKTLLVISLVLLVGTVGLWVRSYWVHDGVQYRSGKREVFVTVFALDGEVCLSYKAWSAATLRRSGDRGSERFASHLSDMGDAFSRITSFQDRAWSSKGRLGFYERSIHIHCWIVAAILALWLAAVVSGYRALARFRRRRHNLCVTCGYDLRGNVSGVCSECGATVEREQPKAEATT